jgi:N-acyl amino acid synthase of PEP-CTERM/exosortase system
MNPHRIETADHRTGVSDYSVRKFGANTRPMKQPGPHLQDRHLRRAQELRYQVYCLECGFLSPEDYPDGAETDEHDEDAEHFYAFDADAEMVGYVRLVRPDGDQRFPFQKHCVTSAGGVTLPMPGHAAEISRLMVRRDYRRQRGNKLVAAAVGQKTAVYSGDRRQAAAQVLLSLYRQMYVFSRTNGIGHWYAAMECTLARSLLRLNIVFKPIGPQTDYYGPVAPYLASLQEVEAQVGARDPALLEWLQQPMQQKENTYCKEPERSYARFRSEMELVYAL